MRRPVSFVAYDRDGTALPPFTMTHRDFHYNEYEFYGQDSWRIRPNLTLTYGLRWQYHSVPFEANGFEAVSNQNLNTIFPVRVANALQGISGNDAAPIVSYNLGGPANHGPDYYKPDYHDFSPRLGIAYTPSFSSGLLGSLFGNRKTTIRAGGGIVYDRVLSTLSFELDEQSFVFDSNPVDNYGGGAIRSPPWRPARDSPLWARLPHLPHRLQSGPFRSPPMWMIPVRRWALPTAGSRAFCNSTKTSKPLIPTPTHSVFSANCRVILWWK